MAGIQIYNHVQSSASATWDIVHNLGHYAACDVTVTSANGVEKILPLQVIHTSVNETQVVFSEPRTGTARLV
jgi:hypothetical protein